MLHQFKNRTDIVIMRLDCDYSKILDRELFCFLILFLNVLDLLTSANVVKMTLLRCWFLAKILYCSSPSLAYYLFNYYYYWLKIILLVYNALDGLAPCYITDLLTGYSPTRPLRSSGSHLQKALVVTLVLLSETQMTWDQPLPFPYL